MQDPPSTCVFFISFYGVRKMPLAVKPDTNWCSLWVLQGTLWLHEGVPSASETSLQQGACQPGCYYLDCYPVGALYPSPFTAIPLTHWGRMTHICVDNLTIIGSDNGLSPGRRQAIIWTNAGILLINWTLRNKLRWNFNRYANIFIQENVFESVVCEMATILSRPQCVKDWTPIDSIFKWVA